MKVGFLYILMYQASILFSQGIAINETGDNPDGAAILDVSSTKIVGEGSTIGTYQQAQGSSFLCIKLP